MSLQEIPLSAIKSEVLKQWQEVTHSSVLTLVAFASGTGRAEQVSTIIEAMPSGHPSRTIIVSVDPASGRTQPTATVEVRPHIVGAAHIRVGSEQVILNLPESATMHLSDYVTPLLLSDMPVFVWWMSGSLANVSLIDDLVDIGDYLIFDSADFGQPEQDITRLAATIQRWRDSPVNYKAFNDFNWARIFRWREQVAQCFDPPYTPLLESLSRVRIGYACAKDSPYRPTQAYLLAGWLAHTLGWEVVQRAQDAGGRVTITCKSSNQSTPLTVEIEPYTVPNAHVIDRPMQMALSSRPGLPELLSGTLLFFEAHAEVSGRPASFQVMRSANLVSTTTQIDLGDGNKVEPLVAPLDMADEATLLTQQLRYFTYEHSYEEVVLAARAFAVEPGK